MRAVLPSASSLIHLVNRFKSSWHCTTKVLQQNENTSAKRARFKTESYLQLISIKARLDGICTILVGNRQTDNRWLEHLHLEPILVLSQPHNPVMAIIVPALQALRLADICVVQTLKSIYSYYRQTRQHPNASQDLLWHAALDLRLLVRRLVDMFPLTMLKISLTARRTSEFIDQRFLKQYVILTRLVHHQRLEMDRTWSATIASIASGVTGSASSASNLAISASRPLIFRCLSFSPFLRSPSFEVISSVSPSY
jgi:hypothetical protein